MKNKVIRIIEREIEMTSDKTYAEYLKQLMNFLLNRKKDLDNYDTSINDFKDFLIDRNNYCIGDLCTIDWCEFIIKYNEERLNKGEEIKNNYTNPKEQIEKYKKKIEELRANNYEEKKEKELKKYTDKIISIIEGKQVQDIANYELAREKIESKLRGETKELAKILLDYLEEEKEKILKEISDNKK